MTPVRAPLSAALTFAAKKTLLAAISVYRANPYRPHCDAAAGRHVWLCNFLGLNGGAHEYCPLNPFDNGEDPCSFCPGPKG